LMGTPEFAKSRNERKGRRSPWGAEFRNWHRNGGRRS
jgi:hypothetical protein